MPNTPEAPRKKRGAQEVTEYDARLDFAGSGSDVEEAESPPRRALSAISGNARALRSPPLPAAAAFRDQHKRVQQQAPKIAYPKPEAGAFDDENTAQQQQQSPSPEETSFADREDTASLKQRDQSVGRELKRHVASEIREILNRIIALNVAARPLLAILHTQRELDEEHDIAYFDILTRYALNLNLLIEEAAKMPDIAHDLALFEEVFESLNATILCDTGKYMLDFPGDIEKIKSETGMYPERIFNSIALLLVQDLAQKIRDNEITGDHLRNQKLDIIHEATQEKSPYFRNGLADTGIATDFRLVLDYVKGLDITAPELHEGRTL